MKKLIFSFIVAYVISAPLGAQSPAFNTTQYRGSFAKEKLVVSSTVKTLTASVYNPACTNCIPSNNRADYAVITVETDCLRFWSQGSDPTTTDGHKVCDGGQILVWSYSNILNLKMIRVTTDVTIQVSYYRYASNTN